MTGRETRLAGVKPGAGLIPQGTVTERMMTRAREEDKIPGWFEPYLREVLQRTLDSYVGFEPERGAHIFAFDGAIVRGVYAAAGPDEDVPVSLRPWVAAIGGSFAREVSKREISAASVATYLGAVMRALTGGRTKRPYVRGDPGESPENLDLF